MNLKQFLSPQVARWIAVGFAFAGLGLGLIEVMTGLLRWPYAVVTLLSGEICTMLRFLVVDRWVFTHARPSWTRLWQFHLAGALGFGVWWAAANVLKSAGVHYLVASVLAMGCSVGVSLLTNFLWVWRKPVQPS